MKLFSAAINSGQHFLETFPAVAGFSGGVLQSGCVRGSPNSDLVGLGVAEDVAPARGTPPLSSLLSSCFFFFYSLCSNVKPLILFGKIEKPPFK